MIDGTPQPINEGRASGKRIATFVSGALIVTGALAIAAGNRGDATSEKDVAPVGWSPVEQDRFTSCFRETGEWILGAIYESDYPHDKRMNIDIISAPGAIETVDDDDAEGGQDVTATAFAKFPSAQGSAVIEFAFTYPGSPGEVDKKTISGNKPVEKCPGGETTTTSTTEVQEPTTTTSTTTTTEVDEPTTTTSTTTTSTIVTPPSVTTTTQPLPTTTTTLPNGTTTTSTTIGGPRTR